MPSSVSAMRDTGPDHACLLRPLAVAQAAYPVGAPRRAFGHLPADLRGAAMLSRGERTAWAVVAAAILAGAAAAWFTREAWLPEAGPWLQQLWRKSTRPGLETLPPGKRPAPSGNAARGDAALPPPPPRKCVATDGRVTYTNAPCPKGAQEQAVDGAVSVLPQ